MRGSVVRGALVTSATTANQNNMTHGDSFIHGHDENRKHVLLVRRDQLSISLHER